MHYVIVAGIFGLPFVVCAAVLVAKALDAFVPEGRREPSPMDKVGSPEMASRVRDLADTFIPAPLESDSKP